MVSNSMELFRRSDVAGPEAFLARNQVATLRAKLASKKKDHTTISVPLPKIGLSVKSLGMRNRTRRPASWNTPERVNVYSA